MSNLRFWILILLGALAAGRCHGQDPASSSATRAPDLVTQRSPLEDFLDPELQFAEGCGCYLKRATAAARAELLFFGKLGDQKESGWVAFKGRVVEVPKEKPDTRSSENGREVRVKYYRSADLAIQVELLLSEAKEGEETATYTGELTVIADGLTQKIAVVGSCGC